jgi:ferrous iron transport protein B
MELPPYRFPTINGLVIHTWERTWQYIKKAGTVILGISVLLWAMMTYPGLPEDQVTSFAQKRQQIIQQSDQPAGEPTTKALHALNAEQAAAGLRHSIAGRIGIALEPASQLAGIDWRTNIALLGGFAAKEVIISTLGTAYSIGDIATEEPTSLTRRLASDPAWNPVVALAVLLFIMFYAPCFVTVICIAKESGSWKWAFFSMAFNTAFAFIMAVTVYQIGMLLNLG